MPNFDRLFVMDCDASGAGFSAVLHQGAGPLAYYTVSSLRLMSVNSSGWCKPFVIGARICGGVTFWSVLIITVLNFCLTSACPQFPSISG